MKLFEAIEKYGKGDGVKLVNGVGDIFTPYYQVGPKWYGTNEIYQNVSWHYSGYTDCNEWELYQEPIEMEDRWLWASDKGLVTSLMSSKPAGNTLFHIKLEWSRTSFPKEKS